MANIFIKFFQIHNDSSRAISLNCVGLEIMLLASQQQVYSSYVIKENTDRTLNPRSTDTTFVALF